MAKQTITQDDVKKIANLAMIELTDEEIGVYQKHIEAILEYVELLGEVDVDDVHFSYHAALQNVLREDIVEPSLPQNVALSNRNDQVEKGHFALKSVLPQDESSA